MIYFHFRLVTLETSMHVHLRIFLITKLQLVVLI